MSIYSHFLHHAALLILDGVVVLTEVTVILPFSEDDDGCKEELVLDLNFY